VPAWIFINVALGLGLGVLIPAQLRVIQAATDNKSVGYAVSMSMLVRPSGEAFSIAISGIVFQNILRKSIDNSAVRRSLGNGMRPGMFCRLREHLVRSIES
jgi:hypothetical protein